MVVVHATRKLLDRIGRPVDVAPAPTTALGSWYATVLFWRPQVAMFVNERTLVPVLVPLAPARSVVDRFLEAMPTLLSELGCSRDFVASEVEQMKEHVLDKTRSRSVVGIMNEFSHLGELRVADALQLDLHALSVELAQTPCGPLYKTHTFPDAALRALAAEPPVER